MHSSFAGRRCCQRTVEVNRYRFCFLLMSFFSKAFSTPGIAMLITRSATTSFGRPPRLPHGVFNLGRGHAVDGCLPLTSRRRGNRLHGDGHTSMPLRSRYRKIMNKFLNKSFITNFLSIVIIGFGYISPVFPELIKSIGFFALSGAITNWLAISVPSSPPQAASPHAINKTNIRDAVSKIAFITISPDFRSGYDLCRHSTALMPTDARAYRASSHAAC